MAWDKAVRDHTEPQEDWTECKVMRIRVKGANFPYVRGKLRDAENLSDTDLQSSKENVTSGIQLRRRKAAVSSDDSDSDGNTPLSKVKQIKSSVKSSKSGKSSSKLKPPPQLPMFPHIPESSGSPEVPSSVQSKSSSPAPEKQAVPSSSAHMHGSNVKPDKGSKCPSKSTLGVLEREPSAQPKGTGELSNVKNTFTKRQLDGMEKNERFEDQLSGALGSRHLGNQNYRPKPTSLSMKDHHTPKTSHNPKQAPSCVEKIVSKHEQEGESTSHAKSRIEVRQDLFTSDSFSKETHSKHHAAKKLFGATESTSLFRGSTDSSHSNAPIDQNREGSSSSIIGVHSPAKKSNVSPRRSQSEGHAGDLQVIQKQQAVDMSYSNPGCNTAVIARTSDQVKDKAMNLATNMTELEFKAYVISSLISLKAAVNNNLSTLKRKGKGPGPSSSSDVLLGLPADSVTEWQAFDEKVQKGPESFIDEVVAELSGIGGSDVGSITRSVLSRIFSNRVAAEFSFHGARSKLPFKDTSFMKKNILFKVVKHHIKKATDAEITKIIENWLRLAGQRKGGTHFKKWPHNSASSESVPSQRSPKKPSTKNSKDVSLRRSPRKHPSSSVSLPQRSPRRLTKEGGGTSSPKKLASRASVTPRRARLVKNRKSAERSKADSDSDKDCIMFSDEDQMEYSRDEASGSENDLLSGYNDREDSD